MWVRDDAAALAILGLVVMLMIALGANLYFSTQLDRAERCRDIDNWTRSHGAVTRNDYNFHTEYCGLKEWQLQKSPDKRGKVEKV